MLYRIKVDGQFHDVVFKQIAKNLYHAHLAGNYLGSFHLLRSGWAVTSNINNKGTLRTVEGFKTRWKALEYLLDSSPLARSYD